VIAKIVAHSDVRGWLDAGAHPGFARDSQRSAQTHVPQLAGALQHGIPPPPLRHGAAVHVGTDLSMVSAERRIASSSWSNTLHGFLEYYGLDGQIAPVHGATGAGDAQLAGVAAAGQLRGTLRHVWLGADALPQQPQPLGDPPLGVPPLPPLGALQLGAPPPPPLGALPLGVAAF
jgi:hypothetical protein